MGYFPNGTSGMMYEEQYCQHCVHFKPDDGGCMVWLAHLLHNYDECNNDKSILDLLIPRSENGLGNEECKMFHAYDGDRCRQTKDMFKEDGNDFRSG